MHATYGSRHLALNGLHATHSRAAKECLQRGHFLKRLHLCNNGLRIPLETLLSPLVESIELQGTNESQGRSPRKFRNYHVGQRSSASVPLGSTESSVKAVELAVPFRKIGLIAFLFHLKEVPSHVIEVPCRNQTDSNL